MLFATHNVSRFDQVVIFELDNEPLIEESDHDTVVGKQFILEILTKSQRDEDINKHVF